VSEPLFEPKVRVDGVKTTLRVYPDRLEWGEADAGGRLAFAGVSAVEKHRAGLTVSAVTLTGPRGEVRLVTNHTDAGVVEQLALELAGLPYQSKRRLLRDDQLPPRARPGGAADRAQTSPSADDELRASLRALRDAGVLTDAEYRAKLASLDGAGEGPDPSAM
jgi:hypothetical protein